MAQTEHFVIDSPNKHPPEAYSDLVRKMLRVPLRNLESVSNDEVASWENLTAMPK